MQNLLHLGAFALSIEPLRCVRRNHRRLRGASLYNPDLPSPSLHPPAVPNILQYSELGLQPSEMLPRSLLCFGAYTMTAYLIHAFRQRRLSTRTRNLTSRLVLIYLYAALPYIQSQHIEKVHSIKWLLSEGLNLFTRRTEHGTLHRIRTDNLQFRKLLLYPLS